MFNVIIIEDQQRIAQLIESIITNELPEISISGIAHNAIEGIKLIMHHNPDIVLLDIEMPGGGGFEILDAFPEKNFEVVFVTSHEHYAIKAFKYNAVDYILKPFDDEDIVNAIERVKSLFTQRRAISMNGDIKQETSDNQKKTSHRLIIPFTNGIEYVDTDEILYLMADGKYCHLYLDNQKHILTSKSMNEIILMIETPLFFKCHRSYAVNIQHAKRFIKLDKYYIELNKELRIPLARSKKNDFLALMESENS